MTPPWRPKRCATEELMTWQGKTENQRCPAGHILFNTAFFNRKCHLVFQVDCKSHDRWKRGQTSYQSVNGRTVWCANLTEQKGYFAQAFLTDQTFLPVLVYCSDGSSDSFWIGLLKRAVSLGSQATTVNHVYAVISAFQIRCTKYSGSKK